MTPELKEKWLSDLRSGKYPKTERFLKNDTGYCCLGVLLETTGIGFVQDYSYGEVVWESKDRRFGTVSILTVRGMKEFGLENSHVNNLMNLNDTSETFEEVITYIEENL
jgi:hypothetical protein